MNDAYRADPEGILGADFISPTQITDACACAYSTKQLAMFARTLPDINVLTWLKRHDYLLVAGPPAPMSILDLYSLKINVFFNRNIEHFLSLKQEFISSDQVASRWLMLRKQLVPNSLSRAWRVQQALLNDGEKIPNAPEAIWGAATYGIIRGMGLLPRGVQARTSSAMLNGHHISIEVINGTHIILDCWPNSSAYPFLGLISQRPLECNSFESAR